MKVDSLQKNLIYRYLLWAYKSTRESYERIERKTTQLMVDEHILEILNSSSKSNLSSKVECQDFIKQFEQYIENKKAEEIAQKYSNKNKVKYHPQYLYLKRRLSVIEETIKHFLGPQYVKKFNMLYEKEFVKRILEAKDH